MQVLTRGVAEKSIGKRLTALRGNNRYLAVNAVSMPNLDSDYDQFLIFNIAKYAIVAYPVTPFSR